MFESVMPMLAASNLFTFCVTLVWAQYHALLLSIVAPPVMYKIVHMLRHSSLDIQRIASRFQLRCITSVRSAYTLQQILSRWW